MPQTMMQEPRMVPTSRALASSLSRAANYARQQGHRLVSLEHVLLALTEDEDAMAVLASSSLDIARLRNDVAAHVGRIEDRAHPQDTSAPGIHGDVKRILEYAAAAAQQSRRTSINGAIVLAAIVGEGHSTAAGLLRAQGLTFEVAIQALQRAFAQGSGATASPPPAAPPQSSRVTDAILAGARERVRASRLAATEGATSQTGPSAAIAAPPDHAPAPIAALDENTYDRAPAAPATVAPLADAPAPPTLSLPPDPAALVPPVGSDLAHIHQEPQPQTAHTNGWERPATPVLPQERPLPAAPPHIADPRLPDPGPDNYLAPARQPNLPTLAASPAGHVGDMPQYSPPPPPARDPPHPDWRPSSPGPLQLDAARQPITGPAQSYGVPVPAPWPEAALPGVSAAEAPSLPVDGNFAGAPYPVPDDPTTRGGRPSASLALGPGQLVENIPRLMRVGRPETVEIRIARSSFEAMTQGMPGRSLTFRHDIAVMRAMAVRLKSVDGTFWIEAMSPETQWVENRPGLTHDDFASWRWSVTPRRRGRGDLQLVVTCRTVGDDGVAADTSLPEHALNIRVRTDYIAAVRVWAGRFGAMAVGAAIFKLSDGTAMDGLRALRRLIGI